MSTTISILHDFTPQFSYVASISIKSLIWRSLVLILGRRGLIHLSAATCLCILSVHLLRQLRFEKPFLETYNSSLPSGKELLEFRGLLYAIRANLVHEIVSRRIREWETSVFILVFFLIWINGPPSCKQCHLETQEWLYGLCSCREHGRPPCPDTGRYPTHQKQCPWTYAMTRKRIAGMAKSHRGKPKWTLHQIRPCGCWHRACQVTSDTVAQQEAAVFGKYSNTIKLLFSLHVLLGTLKV